MTLPRYRQEGEGPRAVVFLHGVGSDADSWALQLRHFADAGYRAIAWNLPGYGGSAALPVPSFEAMADALAELLDELTIDQADLVGHSFGGMVAQEFAARHPQRLRTMTLSATSPAFGRPDGEWQQAFVRERLAPVEAGQSMADLADGMLRSLTGPGADAEGLEIARRSIAQVPTATFAAGIRLIVTFDRRDGLARIAVPTLVLAGERDTNAPAAMMEKMASKIPGARFVSLAGAGHLANVERPAAFNAELQRFLAAH